MIVALVFGYLFFGGASSTLMFYGHSPQAIEKAVKKEITDDHRKDAVLPEIAAWKKRLEAQDKEVGKVREMLLKSLKQHDATRREADERAATLDQSFREMDRDFLDTRFRIKGILTKEEWTAVTSRLNHP
jgi:hypothetical protein